MSCYVFPKRKPQNKYASPPSKIAFPLTPTTHDSVMLISVRSIALLAALVCGARALVAEQAAAEEQQQFTPENAGFIENGVEAEAKAALGKKPVKGKCPPPKPGSCPPCVDRFNCDPCHLQPHKDHSSSSSSSSSSSDSSCVCPTEDCQRVYLNDLDFYTHYPRLPLKDNSNADAPGIDWTYWSEGGPVWSGGPDSSLTFSCRGGFLDTKVYTNDYSGTNPYAMHYQYFITAKELVPMPKSGSLVFEYIAAVKTYKTEQNPYPDVLISDAADDVRLATGVFQVLDEATRLRFSFYMTNDRVYVGYERQIDVALQANAVAAFNFLIPVKIRKTCDIHTMKILFNPGAKYVSWFLDGREVYRVTRVGFLLNREFMTADFGGAEEDVFPASLDYGFGSFTLLDNYPACMRSDSCRSCKFPDLRQALSSATAVPVPPYFNPVLGSPVPAVFYDSTTRVWGQGSETAIKRLAVYTQVCQ